MQTALMIIHVIVSIALIVVVLLQHGKQQGLSGAIAGGAETFFGKNKGRTVDAMLKKVTAVIAALFIILTIVIAIISVNDFKSANTELDSATEQNITVDENGNLVNADGDFILDENGNPMNVNSIEDGSASEASEDATSDEAADVTAEDSAADAPAENTDAEAPAAE